jgi:hypothetical protein
LAQFDPTLELVSLPGFAVRRAQLPERRVMPTTGAKLTRRASTGRFNLKHWPTVTFCTTVGAQLVDKPANCWQMNAADPAQAQGMLAKRDSVQSILALSLTNGRLTVVDDTANHCLCSAKFAAIK